MVNKCELSANRRHSQQAKDADRLGPKGTWSVQGLKTSLSWTNDHRRIERTSPTLADKWNTVARIAPSGKISRKASRQRRR